MEEVKAENPTRFDVTLEMVNTQHASSELWRCMKEAAKHVGENHKSCSNYQPTKCIHNSINTWVVDNLFYNVAREKKTSSGAASQSTEDNEKARYNLRSCLKKVVVNFKGIHVDCLTDGKEAIIHMLEKYCPLTQKQTMKNSNMIFTKLLKPSGCVINLGLPTAVLDDKVKYKCTFNLKRLGNLPLYANTRKFHVQKYESLWHLKFFYISVLKGCKSQPDIGDIKDKANIIEIAYFPEETLYEAIYRDGRLKIKNEKGGLLMKRWYLKGDNDVVVELLNNAQLYSDTNFSLHWRQAKDERLPDKVPPLPEPSYTSCTGIKSETSSTSSYHDVEPTYNSDAQATMPSRSIKCRISSNEELREFIKDIYGVDVEKQEDKREEKTRISKIKQVFKINYDNFSLSYKHQIFTSDMKNLMKMSDSVGAVFVELSSRCEKKFVGTCFVIGSRFVITNRHVLEDTKNVAGFKDFYVDFNFANPDVGNKFRYRFDHKPVVSSPQGGELDYAILKLRDPSNAKLPPSLSKCGYVIPSSGKSLDAGKCLTLVGHPAGLPKATDVTCPVNHPDNLSKNIVVGLSRRNPWDLPILHDSRRQLYDTSTFFHGSSGSPGVLIRERLLMVLHCRGFHLDDPNDSVIEQGIKMSAILDDVACKINQGNLPGLTLKDIFDIDNEMESMETD